MTKLTAPVPIPLLSAFSATLPAPVAVIAALTLMSRYADSVSVWAPPKVTGLATTISPFPVPPLVVTVRLVSPNWATIVAGSTTDAPVGTIPDDVI